MCGRVFRSLGVVWVDRFQLGSGMASSTVGVPIRRFGRSFQVVFRIFAWYHIIVACRFLCSAISRTQAGSVVLFRCPPLLLRAFNENNATVQRLIRYFRADLIFFLVGVRIRVDLFYGVRHVQSFGPMTTDSHRSHRRLVWVNQSIQQARFSHLLLHHIVVAVYLRQIYRQARVLLNDPPRQGARWGETIAITPTGVHQDLLIEGRARVEDQVHVTRDHGKQDWLRRTNGYLADHFQRGTVLRRLVLTVLRGARVCVRAKAHFSDHSLQDGHGIRPMLMYRVASRPFNSRRLINNVFRPHERRFGLVLFVCFAVRNGVAGFQVPMFCLSSHLYSVLRALHARLIRLHVEPQFVVSTLVDYQRRVFLVHGRVVLRLSRHLRLRAYRVQGHLTYLIRHVFEQTFRQFTVLVGRQTRRTRHQRFKGEVSGHHARAQGRVRITTAHLSGQGRTEAIRAFPTNRSYVRVYDVIGGGVRYFRTPIANEVRGIRRPSVLLLGMQCSVHLYGFNE